MEDVRLLIVNSREAFAKRYRGVAPKRLYIDAQLLYTLRKDNSAVDDEYDEHKTVFGLQVFIVAGGAYHVHVTGENW